MVSAVLSPFSSQKPQTLILPIVHVNVCMPIAANEAFNFKNQATSIIVSEAFAGGILLHFIQIPQVCVHLYSNKQLPKICFLLYWTGVQPFPDWVQPFLINSCMELFQGINAFFHAQIESASFNVQLTALKGHNMTHQPVLYATLPPESPAYLQQAPL